MFGFDERIAEFSQGASLWVVLAVAVLLGLRHAADPDHLAAVAALVASDRIASVRRARQLGLAWGLGHAAALTALGVPIVLLDLYLPEALQRLVEGTIALVIVGLAVRLLVRWRRGHWHAHTHVHAEGLAHAHRHAADDAIHAHRLAERRVRTPLGAFAIGAVHGIGGSAGIGVLLLSSIASRGLALGALLLFALLTAAAMTLLSSGFGHVVARHTNRRRPSLALPVLAVISLAFGLWYGFAVVAASAPAA